MRKQIGLGLRFHGDDKIRLTTKGLQNRIALECEGKRVLKRLKPRTYIVAPIRIFAQFRAL
jgi:hypothetical protein